MTTMLACPVGGADHVPQLIMRGVGYVRESDKDRKRLPGVGNSVDHVKALGLERNADDNETIGTAPNAMRPGEGAVVGRRAGGAASEAMLDAWLRLPK